MSTLLVLTLAAGSARAQRDRRTAAVPLTRYVPASAGVFISVSHLGEVNEALHQANAWAVVPILVGSETADALPSDLQDAVTRMLRGMPSIRAHELIHSEVGLAARSLDGFAQALLFLRVPDDATLDRWFPEDRRTATAAFGEARSFRMDNGLIVCARDGIVAIGRRSEGDRVLLDAMYLMRGRPGKSIEAVPAFVQSRSYLPPRPLATLFMIEPARAATGASGRTTEDEADRDDLVVALYPADGGLDIAVRGSVASPRLSGRVSVEAMDRLLRLPRSTMFAAVWPTDLAGLLNPSPDTSRPVTVFQRYLRFLLGLHALNGDSSEPLPALGPNLIVVWDQDLRPRSDTPQLALAIESADAPRLTRIVTGIANRLAELIARTGASRTEAEISVEQAQHLGVPYTCMPLRGYAEASPHPFAKLLGNVEPCWAADSGWFVITLGRDHLERMLGARRGLVPTLSSVRDTALLRRRPGGLGAAALVQGDLGSDVLDEWLRRAARDPGGSLLAPGWWDELANPGGASRRRVGVGMRARQDPGVVIVGRVYPDTAAEGLLEVGDRILGIDGALLALERPNADLRRRLHESRARPGPTLRVQRGDLAMDIVLPLREAEATLPRLGMSPIEAVRELSSVVRAISFVSFALTSLDQDHYAARLTVRFASDETAMEIPPE